MRGMVRRHRGYRIERRVRELDPFQQTQADALDAFADTGRAFTRRHEKRGARVPISLACLCISHWVDINR